MLDFEEWLAQEADGWNTNEEKLACEASEAGLTTETDFSLENYLVDAYEKYATLNKD